MNTYNTLTDQQYQTLADLLEKQRTIGLTDEEQALLDELREKDRNSISAAQIETLREAARQTAKLIDECGLTLAQLAFHREMLDRLARNDTSITPEEMREFEDVRGRIERCLRGGGNRPGGGSDPDDSGPDITDALGVQPVEDDEEEAEPSTALPVEEPMQIPVPGKPDDDEKKKRKPRPRVPGKRDGVDFP